MTLVVAGIALGVGWMISDTIIWGRAVDFREGKYLIKCLPSGDRRGLISFSGDIHYGARLIESAARMPTGPRVIKMLCEAQSEYPNIDFLYMFLDETSIPHLLKVSAGQASKVSATYIGEHGAFEQFQAIRHAAELDPVPESFEQLFLCSTTPDRLPESVSTATISMLRLIHQRTERDVGGWAVPYVLSRSGVHMCGYAYSVSDPISGAAKYGDVIPHGTAEAGGYGLSVTEFGRLEGIVVYRRQQPGGLVFVREEMGYKAIEIQGEPSEFCSKGSLLLGKQIGVIFGDAQLGRPESISILRDKQGQASMAIARQGDNFSFSTLNNSTAFSVDASVDLFASKRGHEPVTVQNLAISLADDKSRIEIKFFDNDQLAGASKLDTNDLDVVIATLGKMRARLTEPISSEPDKSPGSAEFVVFDPAWRTEQSPHASLDGIIMRLRHLGFGWTSFFIPNNEAKALGRWLIKNSKLDESA